MWTRELLKRNAKEIFKRNYWTCVGVSLVLAALPEAAVLLSEESEETTPVFLIIIMEVIITMEILPEVL